jgi:hypothetical protein
MNFLTYMMHLASSGAIAYYSASQIRDPQTRPNTLAGLQLTESGSVPFLQGLSERAAKEGDTWLAEKIAKHATDETRHGQIFAHALKQLNKQVIDFKNQPQTKSANKSQQQRSPFFGAYFEGYSQEQLKPATINWNVFMASTYILELDACKDFKRMANALPDENSRERNLKLGMLNIAIDEKGHAAYLYEAMLRRMSVGEVEILVEQWRSRKVKALWATVGDILQRKGETRSLVQDDVASSL